MPMNSTIILRKDQLVNVDMAGDTDLAVRWWQAGCHARHLLHEACCLLPALYSLLALT